ncbi:hypothetical protein LSCM4_04777 [Leishmania orientalis]|uniref:Uncharacterized protein n=1 Tax=Leishmania orientalis TaxID=2249476 RepID=A0A836GR46_9TRYP|nr:hypothetical protein LSCM4_04777 [Leishmania orientalis]
MVATCRTEAAQRRRRWRRARLSLHHRLHRLPVRWALHLRDCSFLPHRCGSRYVFTLRSVTMDPPLFLIVPSWHRAHLLGSAVLRPPSQVEATRGWTGCIPYRWHWKVLLTSAPKGARLRRVHIVRDKGRTVCAAVIRLRVFLFLRAVARRSAAAAIAPIASGVARPLRPTPSVESGPCGRAGRRPPQPTLPVPHPQYRTMRKGARVSPVAPLQITVHLTVSAATQPRSSRLLHRGLPPLPIPPRHLCFATLNFFLFIRRFLYFVSSSVSPSPPSAGAARLSRANSAVKAASAVSRSWSFSLLSRVGLRSLVVMVVYCHCARLHKSSTPSPPHALVSCQTRSLIVAVPFLPLLPLFLLPLTTVHSGRLLPLRRAKEEEGEAVQRWPCMLVYVRVRSRLFSRR